MIPIGSNNEQLTKLLKRATTKWSYYEKTFFEGVQLSERQRLSIITAMCDLALAEVTDNLISINMEINNGELNLEQK